MIPRGFYCYCYYYLQFCIFKRYSFTVYNNVLVSCIGAVTVLDLML